MNFGSSAPVRQPSPDLSEREMHVAVEPSEMPGSEGNSLAYLRLLWSNRRWLSWVVGYSILASTLLAFLIPARYEATARLMPPDNQSTSGLAMAAAAAMSGANGGLGGIASDFLGLKSTSDVFVGIATSRTVQDRLIEQFDLKKLYRDSRMENARKDLAAHTSVSVDRKSQIISITVTDKSPQRAAAMGQAYVEELNNLVAELSSSSARRERIFLEARLRTIGEDLEAAERNFSQFASKNTAIDVKEQGKAMVEAAATLQGQLIGAQSQYEGLREIYTDNNPRVRTVKARIDELRRQLEKLGGKGESETSVQNASVDSMYPSIRKLPLLGVAYADLYREMKIREAVLETLTKEYEMAKVQEVKEIPAVKILDAAGIPDTKSFPPRMLIILLGTTCALAGAMSWVCAKAVWKQMDPKDLRKAFANEVLADLENRLPRFSRNGSGFHRRLSGGIRDDAARIGESK